MRDKEIFFKKNAQTLIIATLVSLSGLGLLLFEQNNYDFSPFEAGTNSLEKTILIQENGDVNFVERYQRFIDYQVIFQDLYFTSDNEDVPSTVHTPQFDTTLFENRIYDMNNNLLIAGNGTEEVFANTAFGANMKLSYSWLPNATDERGDRIVPLDNQSVSLFHYKEDYFSDIVIEYDYWIRGVALKYSDTAEFYWVIAATDGMRTNNVDVSIVLPTNTIALNEVDAYIFGANQGRIHSKTLNNQGQVVINVKANRLFPGEFITARINFPASALTISSQQNDLYGNDVQNYPLGTSTHLENVARYQQTIALQQTIYRVTDSVVLIITAVMVIWIFFKVKHIYITYDREHASDFYGEYYRELPGDYPPAIMSYLYRFKSIEKDDVTATLMDLVRRGFVKIDAGTESLTKAKVNYTLIRDKTKNMSDLKNYEKQLLSWFFDTVAGGDSLTLNQLENYTKKESQAIRYMNDNQSFNRTLYQEASTMSFFDHVQPAVQKRIGFLGFVFLFGISFYALRYLFTLGTLTGIFGGLLIGIAIGVKGYTATIERRSKQGNEDYVRWRAFKKFLEEFTNIKDYPMPGITIWEHYMVYAISFGIADLVEKQLRFKYQQLNRTEELNRSPYFRYPGFYRAYYYGVGRSFMNAQSTIAQAQRNNSARGGGRFGGGGGGFTGGGGSGVRLR
jgi:uncharacterized membrane protein